ncbi:unnamed protein product, partial [Durusdinium trenchii]
STWLQIGCCGNFIRGMGGPGAPHYFALDRRDSLGGAYPDVQSAFWVRRGVTVASPDDVILRTKRYMADAAFQDKVLLRLPARVAAALQGPPVGVEPFALCNAADYLEQLADGANAREPLYPIGAFFPSVGPAVGSGGVAIAPRGQNVEPGANVIKLQADSFKRPVLDKYKSRRKNYYVYQTAARLWSHGLPWELALNTVQEAFDAVIEE